MEKRLDDNQLSLVRWASGHGRGGIKGRRPTRLRAWPQQGKPEFAGRLCPNDTDAGMKRGHGYAR